MRLVIRALAIAAGAMLGLAAHAQTEIKISHFLPPVHGIHTDFIEPWGKALEQCSGGRVTVKVFPGNSALGNVANQLDQVRAGVVDIAHGLHGIPRGRFPRTQIIEMPFLTDNADTATRTLWAVYPKYLKDEYKGLKVLALHAHNGGLIHTRDKKVATMDDLRSLRIRSPSAPINSMLTFLGAQPVGLPPGAVYENLQKGVIDGAVFPWDPVKSFKLDEVTKYHLDARSYTVSFYFVMNEKKYQSLPADVRKCIDAASGDALIPKFGGWWNKWDQAGLEAAKARNGVITTLSPEERSRWVEALGGMLNREMLSLESQGIKNAREIYFAMQAENARFAKMQK